MDRPNRGTNNECVIVAIPSDDSPVWKVSSEKIPHMTILYLGQQVFGPTMMQIVQFVQHAVDSSFCQFGLTVDRRGILGGDEADVLFFDRRYIKDVERFRSQLLSNDDISKAYHSVDQYPSWIPHLTLGYPKSPAKEELPNHHDWVTFDRIAVWFGNYEGPEFRLKRPNEEAEVSMSDIQHYGIKGMKWGVRRSDAQLADARGKKAQKKLAKADGKWERRAASDLTFIQIHNAATVRMNRTEIDRINNKAEYRDKDFSKDSPLRRKYYKEYEDTFTRIMDEEAQRIVGTNPSGTRRLRFGPGEGGDVHLQWEDVKHAETAEYPDFVVETDENGYILSIDLAPYSAVQGEKFVADVLSHYGIKGMKWGVRRSDAELARSRSGMNFDPDSGDTKSIKKIKKKVQKNQGRIDSLSNKELQEFVSRMNLEQQYSRLTQEPTTIDKIEKGQRNARAILGIARTAQDVYSLANGPMGKAIRKAIINS